MLKDSGARRSFETGAVRDMSEGKGRFDLAPLDIVSEIIADRLPTTNTIIAFIYNFQSTNDDSYLLLAISNFIHQNYPDIPTAMLEVAKHFEDGAKKYGENNWQKGLPINCYIDSAIRHYMKFLRGDTDEPHDRAFLWNLMCCVWTLRHKSKRCVETSCFYNDNLNCSHETADPLNCAHYSED